MTTDPIIEAMAKVYPSQDQQAMRVMVAAYAAAARKALAEQIREFAERVEKPHNIRRPEIGTAQCAAFRRGLWKAADLIERSS